MDFEKINNSNSGIMLNTYKKNGFDIISIEGQLDTYNSNIFMETLTKIIEEYSGKQIVFDLVKLNYVSSTGIGGFLNLLKLCSSKGVDMYLMAIQSKVHDVFQLLGFTSFLNFIEDLSEIKLIFPKVIQCPHCLTKLKATKAGKFKCNSCGEAIKINEMGETA